MAQTGQSVMSAVESAAGGEADSMCSRRAFRVVTHSGRAWPDVDPGVAQGDNLGNGVGVDETRRGGRKERRRIAVSNVLFS